MLTQGTQLVLLVAAVTAIILYASIFVGLAYRVLRFATTFLQMRRDIEELKIALRRPAEQRSQNSKRGLRSQLAAPAHV